MKNNKLSKFTVTTNHHGEGSLTVPISARCTYGCNHFIASASLVVAKVTSMFLTPIYVLKKDVQKFNAYT